MPSFSAALTDPPSGLSTLSKPCTTCAHKQQECDCKHASCAQCLATNDLCAYDGHKDPISEDFSDDVTTAFDAITKEITIQHQISNTIRRATRDARDLHVDESFPLRDEQGRDLTQDLTTMFMQLIDINLPQLIDDKLPCAQDNVQIRDRFITS